METKNRTGGAMRRRSLLISVALGLLIAACSNSGSSSSSSSSGSTSSSSGASSSSSASSSSGDTSTHVPITGVPGVKDTEIDFAALGTNSNNPLGTCVLDCFSDGIQAFFDFKNSTGGIWGRKLVLSKKVDDELANNQPKALEIISANDTFGTFTAAQLGSGWADLANAGIPTYTWAINPAQTTGHPEIFGNAATACIDCTARYPAYVTKIAGATKVATLGYGISENSKQCADATAKSIEKYSANIGGAHSVYTNDNLAFGLSNGIGPEVTAIKDSGAQIVFACIDLNGMKTLGEEMQRQGIRDTVKLYHPNTYDQDFVKAANGLFTGDYIGVQFRPFEADASGTALADYQKWMASGGRKLTELAMDGWINASLAYEGLKGAGPSFDRARVIAATNQLTAFTAGGLVAPIDWSREHVAPTEDDIATHGSAEDCFSFVQVQSDGSFKVVGDAAKPFVCWPGNTRDWSEPVNKSFK